MTEKTKKLIELCKQAGYEGLTIFVADKRVPLSVELEKKAATFWYGAGEYWGFSQERGFGRVVCCCPEQLDENNWPKIRTIVRELGLTSGMIRGGAGYGDSHSINPWFCSQLTPGYYDLTNNDQPTS